MRFDRDRSGSVEPRNALPWSTVHPNDFRRRLSAVLDPDPAPDPAPGDRVAAVLVPVVETEGRSVIFTRRAERLSRHAGQISFPGGLHLDGDGSLMGTALRESEEEIGLSPTAVRIAGALAPVHTSASRILIVPFVGVLAGRPVLRPNADEVAEVLEYPLARLMAAETEVEFPRNGYLYRGPVYAVEGNTIWGATAAILHELIERARRVSV